MHFTGFSMEDARWGDLGLGVAGGLTVSQAGCLLCGMAGVLDSFEVDTDPGRLNRWLSRNNGFTGGNLLVFNAVERLADVRLVKVIDCWSGPAPMEEVEEHVALGRAVLALVDMRPGGSVQQHWVWLLREEGDDWLVMDPWLEPGEEFYYLLARYAAPTWDDVARSVFRLAVYEQAAPALEESAAPIPPSFQAQGVPVQKKVCRRRRDWRLKIGGLQVRIGRR